MSSPKSTSIQKVAVIGATGALGPPVIKHLLSTGFQVSLLTRDLSKLTPFNFPQEIKLVKADYTSASSLSSSLHGHDAVIDLTNRTATAIQLLIIDATIAAEVPHLIPSCFGTGTTKNPRIKVLPHRLGKDKMEEYVLQKSKEGALTFTGIETGAFLDLAFGGGWFINCKGDRPTMLFDGGDWPISLTSVDSIGKAVAAALKKPEETKNKFLYLQNTAVSQNQTLKLARELKPEREWKGVSADVKGMEKASWEAWNKGERGPMAEMGFFVANSFGEGSNGLFERVDNELLGIEEFSDEELKEFLVRYI